MLGEFESFHCNRKIRIVIWYGKLNFLPAPHSVLGIDYQTPGK